MLVYLMLSSSFSLSLASPGISASGIDLGILLVSGSNCRLVLLGIWGRSFTVLSCSLVQLTSWSSSHLPASTSSGYWWIFHKTTSGGVIFIISMFSVFEIVWSILCSTSNGMTPSGNCIISKFNSYRLLVSGTIGILYLQRKLTLGEYRISSGLWDALGYQFPINSDGMHTCGSVACIKPVIPVQHLT